jgi:hypothetical protein
MGHVVSVDGVSTDPNKIAAVQAWPQPTDVKQLYSFLDLTGYYCKFVKHYAFIARPLTTANHTTTFATLK